MLCVASNRRIFVKCWLTRLQHLQDIGEERLCLLLFFWYLVFLRQPFQKLFGIWRLVGSSGMVSHPIWR